MNTRTVIARARRIIACEREHLIGSYSAFGACGAPLPNTVDDPLALELIATYDAWIADADAVLSTSHKRTP